MRHDAWRRRQWPRIDLRSHAGVHPRLGAVDVVPFVPLPDTAGSRPDRTASARRARRRGIASPNGPATNWRCPASSTDPSVHSPTSAGWRFARSNRMQVPDTHTQRLGPSRSEPGRCWWRTTCGSPPTATTRMGWATPITPCPWPAPWPPGCANPSVRALGLPTGAGAQVSFNLDRPGVGLPRRPLRCGGGGRGVPGLFGAPGRTGRPAARRHPRHGSPAIGGPELDLAPERTIESRMEAAWQPPSGA